MDISEDISVDRRARHRPSDRACSMFQNSAEFSRAPEQGPGVAAVGFEARDIVGWGHIYPGLVGHGRVMDSITSKEEGMRRFC